MSHPGDFSKKIPGDVGNNYRRKEEYDPVLRSHLHLKPPEPEETSSYTGRVKVNGEWMTKEEYKWRYPDFSETEKPSE